jgi:acetyltransferase-like isoleucine patch superfamily enzyme
MKNFFKNILYFGCCFIVLPLVIVCKIEERFISRHSETIFHICTNLMALFPGLPGVFLRRSFYSMTLQSCAKDCHIGFGTLISHRDVTIQPCVYVGNYSLLGSCFLSESCYIGSRVSILSGKNLHALDSEGHWMPYSPERLIKVVLSQNVWVGEGAIIMADVGRGSMVAAGAVVTSAVAPGRIVAGNPARIVRELSTSKVED